MLFRRCGLALKGKRWQCSAARGLTRPIIFNGGVRAIATHWVYECPRTGNFCKNGTKRLTYGATEVGILKQVEQQLGRHVRCMYPVELEYAFPNSFMHLVSCFTGLLINIDARSAGPP